MTRILYAIQSDVGYLKDIEEYTTDVEQAVTFVCFDTAVQRLSLCLNKLTHECKVVPIKTLFPRKTAKQFHGPH
jgi:hypothetical protein